MNELNFWLRFILVFTIAFLVAVAIGCPGFLLT
jgi:hypothetical protein